MIQFKKSIKNTRMVDLIFNNTVWSIWLLLRYYSQSIGYVEVSNQEIKIILGKSMNSNRMDLSWNLNNALRVYLTAFNTHICITPIRSKRVKYVIYHLSLSTNPYRCSRSWIWTTVMPLNWGLINWMSFD